MDFFKPIVRKRGRPRKQKSLEMCRKIYALTSEETFTIFNEHCRRKGLIKGMAANIAIVEYLNRNNR